MNRHQVLAMILGLLLCEALAACNNAAPSAPTSTPPASPVPASPSPAVDYICPMDADVHSTVPGRCPTCGMDLVAAAAAAASAASTNSKPKEMPTVKLATTPTVPVAKQATDLVFRMEQAGAALTDFEVVHEKKVHLLMVTPDLAWFAHEHPELQPDGSFTLRFTFPAGGTYRLFSDFKPSQQRGYVVPVDVSVKGTPAPVVPLTPTDLSQPRAVGAYRVRMTSPPRPVGVAQTLEFIITKDGKLVNALEPYLGAMGHLVVLHEDARTMLHAHPADHEEHDDKPPAAHVSFQTKFQKAGRYKMWAQFQHQGQLVVADFVVDIAP
jgi:plastocyanin